MKTRDVLGFGCATIDELLFIEEWPQAERKTPIQRRETQGGGLGATALIAAARLGANCAYGGMLGDDADSQRVVQLLAAEGIPVDLVAHHQGAGAIRSFVFVNTLDGTRTIFFQRPRLVGTPPDVPEREVAASRCVFIDHYGGAGNVRVCELARKHGVPVVADFERSNVDEFEAFFPLVSHPILSRGFAARLTNEDEPAQMVRALWNPQRAAALVTCGEEGAYSTENGRDVAHHRAFETTVVDTTGCGDCFHGVYCATLAWEWPLQERIRWASAAAALKARVVGAQHGLPRRADVEALVGHADSG